MPSRRTSLAVATGIFLIRIYRNILSQLLLQTCRFSPSCSQYAEDSLKAHGFFKGIARTLQRLLRCHPFCPGGIDPSQ